MVRKELIITAAYDGSRSTSEVRLHEGEQSGAADNCCGGRCSGGGGPVAAGWRVAAVVLAVACAALAIALVAAIVIAASGRGSGGKDGDAMEVANSSTLFAKPPVWSDVYSGMSASDYERVRDFLFARSELALSRAAKANLSSNYIYLIEHHLPDKDNVLAYQQRVAAAGAAHPAAVTAAERHVAPEPPPRRAKVVLFMGAEQPKRVRELIVWPVENPASIEPYNATSTGSGRVPTVASQRREPEWSSRPICLEVETRFLDSYLRNELSRISTLLNESFGQWLDDADCERAKRCIFYNAAPRTGASGERYIYAWFYLNFYKLPGYYLHPVSFYVIVEVLPDGAGVAVADDSGGSGGGNDWSASFRVKHVYYNDIRFDSLDDLKRAYENNSARRIVLPPEAGYAQRYGSPERRGVDPDPTGRRLPRHHYPDGRRFIVHGSDVGDRRGRHVRYMSWSFDLYFRSVSGVALHNVAFDGEPVAYELSMQDILAAYSGAEPENFFKAYFDNGWSLGTRAHPLMRDVDCPPGAVYLDAELYAPGADRSVRMNDTTCVFEYRNAVPLRRHYSEDFYGGGRHFAFSMPDSVLIVRQAITLWNYDYIFDYEFHQNGVIELKVSSTGYVAATVNRRPYFGQLIDRNIEAGANIHVHLFNFKMDLDVSGARPNRFMTVDLEPDESTKTPLAAAPERPWRQTRITPHLRTAELEAVTHYNFSAPRYFVVFNPNRTNAHGYAKAYRIQSGSFLKVLLPDDSAAMTGASWARSQLAVTRAKDDERGTASIYTQGHPERPVVDFNAFYADNETIVDEDLVAWATVGMLHVPSAEDVPVTTTPGKTLSVVLAPFSFFDEDPSIRSRDAALVWRRNAADDDRS